MQVSFWYDKLRKFSESKGLLLILAIMHQLLYLFVAEGKVFIFRINKQAEAARSLCLQSHIHGIKVA